MITPETIEKLNSIYNYFGNQTQLKKLFEECTEYKDAFIFRDQPIEGEIADLLMLSVQHYLNNPEVRRQFAFKLNRTLQRIGDGYYKDMRTVRDQDSRGETPQV